MFIPLWYLCSSHRIIWTRSGSIEAPCDWSTWPNSWSWKDCKKRNQTQTPSSLERQHKHIKIAQQVYIKKEKKRKIKKSQIKLHLLLTTLYKMNWVISTTNGIWLLSHSSTSIATCRSFFFWFHCNEQHKCSDTVTWCIISLQNTFVHYLTQKP